MGNDGDGDGEGASFGAGGLGGEGGLGGPGGWQASGAAPYTKLTMGVMSCRGLVVLKVCTVVFCRAGKEAHCLLTSRCEGDVHRNVCALSTQLCWQGPRTWQERAEESLLTWPAMVNVIGTMPGPLTNGTLITEFPGVPRGTFRVELIVFCPLKEPVVPMMEAIRIIDL